MSRRLGAVVVPLAASLLLMAPVVALASPADAAQRPVGPESGTAFDPDPTSRESMRQGYLEVLEPALDTPIGWTGNLASCDAGAPSPAAQEATLTAVNYFRDLVGVEPVVFDAALSTKAQEAALMMARNQALSHTPPNTWDCYSAAGYDGASHSNLYLGRSGADAVAGYMVDPGSSNSAAGHRRWIIDPRQTTMGSGSVSDGSGGTSNALYVIDGGSFQPTPASTPDYLPWPVAGFVPVQLEPGGRWSLSAKGATDFSQATVAINGSSAGITVHPVANGYGPRTLVWNFDPDFAPGDPDRTYHVVVSNILNGGVPSSYAYDVTLFDADPPQLEPQTITFTQPADRSYGAADKALQATASSGLPVTFASQTPGVCSTSGTRGQTVSVEGVGTCTVTADQAGDDTYTAAPQVQRSFAVTKKQLTVTAVDSARKPGEPNPVFDVTWSGFAADETLSTSDVTGAPSCSTPATTGSPEGSYPITCSTGSLSSGHYSFSFVPGSLAVDGTPPAVQAVDAAFRVALGGFAFDWVVNDASAIDGLQEREASRTPSTAFGSWTTPLGWDDAGPTSVASQPSGQTWCVEARARDTVGNISGWTAPSCVHTPVDSALLTAPSSWRNVESTGFWQGSALVTKKKGATLRVPGGVGIDRVGIVGSRCSGCGRVTVFVGTTKVGDISLNGQRKKNRVVLVLPRLTAPRDGEVKVVVASTGKKVLIDGVVVSGAPPD